ncbi:hypothetical protein [Limisalsivibrio acetivorans]|uniref:flagellin N-terminal helical domain-containing protein n=1 Tax=Limisalsivibrio acetivorans TaxID=1304888 RepID=UPI0003B4936A|nr:hypothetical protein [Limisalsivibrio acetivorans]
MRITFNFMTMRYLDGIQKNLNSVADGQQSVNKGRNLLTPEQNPVNYVSALSIQRQIDEMDQFKRNAENALTWITNEDNELQRASSIISDALNEYAVYGLNDSQNATSRKALAGDVKNVLDSMVDIGNANYMGRYIFSGYETQTEPFTDDPAEVSSVVSNQDGGEAFVRKLYSDMPELPEDSYRIQVTVTNGIAKLTMKDSNNKTMLVDTNGADESAGNGNNTYYEMSMKYQEGMVMNTGRGVGIKLPEKDMEGRTLTLDFNFKPGGDIRYKGDDGVVSTKIGYNQDVSINMTGRETFMETYRTLRGTVTNTTNDLHITETTYLSDIDGSNANIADYINISGTDHNGYKIGTARLLAPANVELDMSETTDDERLVQLRYADEVFDIQMEQKGYSDIEEVIFEINRDLENYGLGDEITAVNDGDRVMFMSKKSGDNVKIELAGAAHSTLGFHDPTPMTQGDFSYSATGKDTTFELYYEEFNQAVTTVYKDESGSGGPDNRADLSPGNHEIFINGESVTFTVNAADTAQDIEDSINQGIKDAGFAFEVTADVTDTGGAPLYELKFTMHNMNSGNDTYLATRVSAAGGADDYQFSTPRDSDYPSGNEKRVSDLLEFVEDLYDNAVDASLDNGKFKITDLRSGDSRLSFGINESNTGIGYPMLEKNMVLSGKYEGTIDDRWSINMEYEAADPADPADFDKLLLTVHDKNGNLIHEDTVARDGYSGEPIELTQGVFITLGQIETTTSFSVDMTSKTNLSFGDINIIEDGSNVDVFRSLNNLYDALNLNIPESGIGAPSAWRDDSLNSTAVPYFDGEFRGNYNDLLTYEVQTTNDLTEMYIQRELKVDTEPVKYIPNADLDFDLYIRDGNEVTKKNISIGRDNIFDSLTNPTTGAEPTELAINDDSHLDIYYQDSGVWSSARVTVPAGNYADAAAVAAAINAHPNLPAGVVASDNPDGTLTLSPGGTVSDVVVAGDVNEELGFDNFLPSEVITDSIIRTINQDPDLSDLDVRGYNDNGKLVINSGSGTHEISMVPLNEQTAYMFNLENSANTGAKAAQLNFAQPKVLDLNYYDSATDTWNNSTINVPADPSGEYATMTDLLAAINGAGLPAGVTATANAEGRITFNAGGTISQIFVSGNPAASADPNETDTTLGFYDIRDAQSIDGHEDANLFLADANQAERTLTFFYNDGTEKRTSISVEAKDYANVDELIAEINTELGDAGLAPDIQAEKRGDGRISFVYGGAVNDFHVSGDYDGTMGFYKAGTEAKIKVTGQNGELVGSYTMDTANEKYYVTDGVYNHYDPGYLYATDTYTSAVGSGIEHEVPILDRGETQIHQSLTTVGTRQNRVDSVVNFHTTLTTTNEEIKAEFLGSKPEDQTEAIMEYKMAMQAYETALNTSARVMTMSLLNFL